MGISADTIQLGVAREAVPGTAPDPANFNLLRVTGESVNANAQTVQSNELDPDRGVKDSILTNINPEGSINFELSKSLAFDDLLESLMANTWAADNLRNGALITGRTYVYEKRIQINDTPTYDYHRFSGILVNGMNLQIQPGQPITGSFDFIGRTASVATAELTNTTYVPASTSPVMRAPTVDQMRIFGVDITDCVQNINLTASNNARGVECIGVLGFDDQVLGKFTLEVQFQQLYANRTLYEAYLNQTEGDFRFRVTDGTNTYLFLVPRSKIASLEVVAGGTGQDLVYNLTLAGLLNAATTTVLDITRT